jgi:serine/threonine protein kinase
VCHVERLVAVLCFACARAYWRSSRILRRYVLLPAIFRRWRKYRDLIEDSRTPLASVPARLQLNDRQTADLHQRLCVASIVVLAELDSESAFKSTIGTLPRLRNVTNSFRPRRRTRVHLVATRNYIGIRKRYENRWRFVCELEARCALRRAGCLVPPIVDVDFDELTLTFDYVPGLNLEQVLAAHAAIVLDRDVERHAPFCNLSWRALWLARLLEGKRVLDRAVSAGLVTRVLTEIEKIHAARVIWGDIKYGNIIVDAETGVPWLVDFDHAGYFPLLPAAIFAALCDRERALYNLHFGEAESVWGPDLHSPAPPDDHVGRTHDAAAARGAAPGSRRQVVSRSWSERSIPALRRLSRRDRA